MDLPHTGLGFGQMLDDVEGEQRVGTLACSFDDAIRERTIEIGFDIRKRELGFGLAKVEGDNLGAALVQ